MALADVGVFISTFVKAYVDANSTINENTQGSGGSYNGTRNPSADFKDGTKLTDHFERHGHQFGYINKQQYLKGANDFLTGPRSSTTEYFTSADGTYFQYDKATNIFGIINQYGGISTYFKPDTGINYWLEQIDKYKP